MADHRPGSELRTCSQCGVSFTASAWGLHAHNPGQVRCESPACSRKAVGFCEVCKPLSAPIFQSIAGGLKLCGEHLLEHRRLGHAVRIVDGSVCRLCDGDGQVQSHSVDPETIGGRWVRCPHCQGSGYDADLRTGAPRRSAFAAPPPPRPPAEPPRTTPIDWDALVRAREEQLEAEAEQAQRAAERVRVEQQRAVERARAADPELVHPRELAKATPQQPRQARASDLRTTRRMPSLLSAIAALAAGALIGPLIISPLLPDAAIDQVIELQRLVSEMFG